jgi:hypothetical protein
MRPRFTYEDARGDTQFRSWALPLIVIAICVPIAAAFAIPSQGTAVGMAVAALAVAIVLVTAARSRPFGPMEVADSPHPGHRVLVLTTEDLTGTSLERVAKLAAGAEDVRVVVPAPSRRLDRWLSAEDKARGFAQDRLARSAGALTASGLRVSGSVGDSDPLQAVEDELRSFAADEVVVVADPGRTEEVERLRGRLALPLTTVAAGD